PPGACPGGRRRRRRGAPRGPGRCCPGATRGPVGQRVPPARPRRTQGLGPAGLFGDRPRHVQCRLRREGWCSSAGKLRKRWLTAELNLVLRVWGCCLCDACLRCQAENKQEDCVVVWGECNHSFHNCCMSLWVKQNNRCPLCQQDWVVQRIGK
ncbi:PREDICTED: RING-box protein 2, partial [Corvus brachyrhynchos]|uniref:RING-box protein 2 n=1 Tax=Corvus brachyrhynchos TaxID=85066 RepID=UPI000816498F